MKFSVVADYCARIEAETSRTAITQTLAELLQQVSAHEAAIVCHLCLGQLNPAHIGTQFNIAQEMMVRIVARVMDVDEATIKQQTKELGDIGSVIARGTWSASDELSVEQVYIRLHVIEQLHGPGSQEQKIEQLQQLLLELSPMSAQYVVRIVLGKLRLGFSDMTLIDALSWMMVGDKSLKDAIENAYNACADIGYIAHVLKEKGVEGIRNVSITIGIPIRPAAAERAPTAAATFEKLGPCVAQPKLDGFRIQVHLNKRGDAPAVHFFSRHLTDMSAMFPDLLQAIVAVDVEDLIAEGEAIVFDKDSGVFLPFQETVKRKRKHGVDQAAHEMPLQFFLFDLLYLNGKPLINATHAERRQQLERVVQSAENPLIKVIEEHAIRSGQELKDYFLLNIQAGLEGLVVKRSDAVYQAGKRNFNWIKLKREEGGHLEDTLDCVVLGYYAGEGKRAEFGIGAFLVGVFNQQEDRFETIAKIGTGLKDAEWVELKKKCDERAVKHQPKNVACAAELVPDVWVAPELVVVVRADEITLSPLHSAGKKNDTPGYALRFPRFMSYSFDKGAEEATTVQEVVRLFNDQKMRQ